MEKSSARGVPDSGDELTRLKFALAGIRGDDAYEPLSAEQRASMETAKESNAAATAAASAPSLDDCSGRGLADESSKRMDDSKMDISARAMSASQRNRALAATDDMSRLKFALANVRGDDAYAPLSAERRTKCRMDESSKKMDGSQMDVSARAMSSSQQNRALAATDDISRLKFALASVRGDDAYAPLSAERRDRDANKKPDAKKPDSASKMDDYTGRGFITQEQYETNTQAGNNSTYQPRVAGAWSVPGISSQQELAVSDPNDSDDEPVGEEDRRAQEHESNTPRELEEGLAEATPVEEAPAPEDLQAAEPVGGKNKHEHQMISLGKVALLALAVVVAAVIVVAVTLVHTGKDESLQLNNGDAELEETINEGKRLVGVENRITGALEVLGDAQALESPDSAHSKALSWLLHEDEMQLSSDASNLFQRFVLALFYYSSAEVGPWTSCNPPEGEDTDLCYYMARNGGGLYHGGGLFYDIRWSSHEELLATRWLTGQHECQWAGLFCNKEQEIETLQLDEMNMTGTIPQELALLNNLKLFSVGLNSLHGPFPATLSLLSNLEYLDLNSNLLTGAVPKGWWGLSTLRHVNIGFNNLDSWTIPPTIAQWSNLRNLLVPSSSVTGVIPEEMYQLSNLEFMMLYMNEITGTISTEIGLLQNLDMLSLSWNRMSGTLPSQLSQLTQLMELGLSAMGLTGTIPEEIYLSDYTRLNALILKDNDLIGTISTNIGRMSTLGFLYVDLNPNLVGTLPTEMGLLTKLQKIVMAGTQLSGTIPEELCANRGQGFLSRVKVDCAPISDGSIPMYCPEGCCTKCCNRETGECEETKYQEENPHIP